MYTLHMPWLLRVLGLGVVFGWGLGLQVVCFMPDQTVMPSDMDCCKEMAGDCNGANMSHPCCRPSVRAEVVVPVKIVRHVMPRLDVAHGTTNIVPDLFSPIERDVSQLNDRAPTDIPNGSSLILRI